MADSKQYSQGQYVRERNIICPPDLRASLEMVVCTSTDLSGSWRNLESGTREKRRLWVFSRHSGMHPQLQATFSMGLESEDILPFYSGIFCFLLSSFSSLFLKQFSFPWRDLLITILWTNHPSCKTLKAAQSILLPRLPCNLSRFPCRWKQFLSGSHFLPSKSWMRCCLRGHFIIQGNRKLWKGTSSEATKWQDSEVTEKNRDPLGVTNTLSLRGLVFLLWGVVIVHRRALTRFVMQKLPWIFQVLWLSAVWRSITYIAWYFTLFIST